MGRLVSIGLSAGSVTTQAAVSAAAAAGGRAALKCTAGTTTATVGFAVVERVVAACRAKARAIIQIDGIRRALVAAGQAHGPVPFAIMGASLSAVAVDMAKRKLGAQLATRKFAGKSLAGGTSTDNDRAAAAKAARSAAKAERAEARAATLRQRAHERAEVKRATKLAADALALTRRLAAERGKEAARRSAEVRKAAQRPQGMRWRWPRLSPARDTTGTPPPPPPPPPSDLTNSQDSTNNRLVAGVSAAPSVGAAIVAVPLSAPLALLPLPFLALAAIIFFAALALLKRRPPARVCADIAASSGAAAGSAARALPSPPRAPQKRFGLGAAALTTPPKLRDMVRFVQDRAAAQATAPPRSPDGAGDTRGAGSAGGVYGSGSIALAAVARDNGRAMETFVVRAPVHPSARPLLSEPPAQSMPLPDKALKAPACSTWSLSSTSSSLSSMSQAQPSLSTQVYPRSPPVPKWASAVRPTPLLSASGRLPYFKARPGPLNDDERAKSLNSSFRPVAAAAKSLFARKPSPTPRPMAKPPPRGAAEPASASPSPASSPTVSLTASPAASHTALHTASHTTPLAAVPPAVTPTAAPSSVPAAALTTSPSGSPPPLPAPPPEERKGSAPQPSPQRQRIEVRMDLLDWEPKLAAKPSPAPTPDPEAGVAVKALDVPAKAAFSTAQTRLPPQTQRFLGRSPLRATGRIITPPQQLDGSSAVPTSRPAPSPAAPAWALVLRPVYLNGSASAAGGDAGSAAEDPFLSADAEPDAAPDGDDEDKSPLSVAFVNGLSPPRRSRRTGGQPR